MGKPYTRRRYLQMAFAALLAFAAVFLASVFLAEIVYRSILSHAANFNKKAGVFELYSVGESSMRGIPFYTSPPDIVYDFFSGKLAGKPLEVIELAEGGQSIYPQAIRAIRTLKYRNRQNPAVVLIYAGHNEQIGPNQIDTFSRRIFEALKTRILRHSLLLSNWSCIIEHFFDFSCIRDLAHYEFYLRAVIEAAMESGATPVISTLTSNLSGIEPLVMDNFDSLMNAGEAEKGLKMELRGEYGKALECYARLVEELNSDEHKDPAAPGRSAALLAYFEYRIGKCHQSMGHTAAAKIYLLHALATDPHPFRAKPEQNALIRRLSLEYSIPLVDAEKLFTDHCADGLPGKDLFVDIVHPDTTGYLLLSRAFADRLAAFFQDKIRNDIRDPSVVFTPPGSQASLNADPYFTAGAVILDSGQSRVPIPDRLALAEKNFRKAMSISGGNNPGGNNLAAIGLRIVSISQKNRYMVPDELYEWFRGKSRHAEFFQSLPHDEMKKVNILLSKWETK